MLSCCAVAFKNCRICPRLKTVFYKVKTQAMIIETLVKGWMTRLDKKIAVLAPMPPPNSTQPLS